LSTHAEKIMKLVTDVQDLHISIMVPNLIYVMILQKNIIRIYSWRNSN
jgi:hypothetical protein